LVADEDEAVGGENRRTIHQARPVLLAAAGGKSSDAVATWSHAGQDRRPTLSNGAGELSTMRISMAGEAQPGTVSQV